MNSRSLRRHGGREKGSIDLKATAQWLKNGSQDHPSDPLSFLKSYAAIQMTYVHTKNLGKC